MIANTPTPPYYAVIFTSIRSSIDAGYGDMANRMVELASQQPGFLGAEHVLAQQVGREQWYQAYKTRIALVERDYQFAAGE